MQKTIIKNKWVKIETKLLSLITKMQNNGIEVNLSWEVSNERLAEMSQTVLYDNDDTLRTDAKEIKVMVTLIDIEFIGEVPKINGWNVLGVLERLPASESFLIKSIGDNEVPISYRDHDFKICEHCNNRRLRNKIYVLEQNGETKAVGSTCVKDFTGHKDAEQLIAFMSYLECIDARDKDDEQHGSKYFKTIDFLEECAQSILEFNYRKAGDVAGSTKDITMERYGTIVVSDEAKKITKDAIARVKALTVSELGNEFNFNMRTIVESEYLNLGQLGIASYLVEGHRVKVAKEASKAKALEGKENNHIGALKNRQDFTLTYLRTNSFDNAYGVTYFHSFEDVNGNVIIWKGSKDLVSALNTDLGKWGDADRPQYNDDLVGKELVVKGTVTKHDEFRERKQTYINRCKILKVG